MFERVFNHLSAGSSSAGAPGPSRTAPRQTPAAVWCPRDTCPSSHTHTKLGSDASHTHNDAHESSQRRTLRSFRDAKLSMPSSNMSSRWKSNMRPASGTDTN